MAIVAPFHSKLPGTTIITTIDAPKAITSSRSIDDRV